MMRRVPHLCHVFATFVPGGPQVRTCRIVNALGTSYRHTFMAIDSKVDAAELIAPNVAFDVVPAERGKGGVLYPVWLARRLHSLHPDLTLTYNWGSLDAVIATHLRPGAPLIHAEDGFGPDEATRQKRRRVIARRLLLRRAKFIVAPSMRLVRIMREIWKLPHERVRHIPNGIDCTRFSPGREVELRRSLGIPAEAVVVGTVAHLRPEKNLELLVRSVARSAAMHLMFVGSGPEQGMLEARAAALGLAGRAHFLGAREDTLACYRSMDIFALSSTTEQMPIALVEAMSVGLPVVSTDVGDVRLMVCEPNQRFVVALEHEEAYVEALAGLARSPELRTDLGRKNREKCLRDYRWEEMLETYCRLYETALGRG
ncbi:MAG: glycosyltransferase family 4 protein [Planctomycetota bacterium]